MKGENFKIILTVILILAAAYYLFPSVRFFTMDEPAREELKQRDPDEFANLQKKALKLGLDLQGGMHVVLEVDKSNLDENAAKDATDRALEIIRNRIDEFGVAEPQIQKQGADRIVVDLPALQEIERARNLIGKTALLEFKLVESPENTDLLFKQFDGIAAELLKNRSGEPEEAIDTTTASDEGGLLGDLFNDTTASADTTGSLFGDLEEESGIATLTQYLEFTGISYNVLQEDYNKVKAILESPEIKAAIPADNQLAWSTRSTLISGRETRQLYLLKTKVELAGTHLTDARPNYDQYHAPVVDFTLDRDGGRKFARVTGANINKPLAILLDGKVESAPNIKSKIRDKGNITLGGGASFLDAKDLATVLRAGALPAPVKIIESQIIGPTLGKDSIAAGKTAVLVAIALVLSFMLIYYKGSGLVAGFVVLLNIYFLMAVLAGLHAALTLPGIAGIILTLGITVDASVLIFERIREELRTGKTVKAAIGAGYDRASIAIIDSNISTLIAAGVLYWFGTGPIRGFATTLGVGIIISLFTALIVGKTIFSFRRKAKTLSI